MMSKTTIINYDAMWEKIGEYARKAGRVAARPVLLLFYVMKSKKTSWKDKMMIISTLSYLVFPVDVIDAKRLPIIGWIDEIISISVTIQKVRKNITPEMETKVNKLLDSWFPEYTEFEEIKT